MSPGPEPVRTDPRFSARPGGGPSWASVGVFVLGVFLVLSVGFMVGLAFLVVDTRSDLRELRNYVKAQDYVIDNLSNQYSILEDRTKKGDP